MLPQALGPPAELGGVVDGRQRFGVGLVSLIATLREVAAADRAGRWYRRTLHGLALSPGAIVALLKRVAERGRAAGERIRAGIRAARSSPPTRPAGARPGATATPGR